MHFGDDKSFFDFNPNSGDEGSGEATLSIQDWHITNKDLDSRTSLFYGDWDYSPVGMSGDPIGNQDFLWAGWNSEFSYALVVESDGDVALCSRNGGTIYVYGQSLEAYIKSLIPKDPKSGNNGSPTGTPDTEGDGPFAGISINS